MSLNISRIFVLRPIATSLLMLALLLIGAMAYRSLPVAALPNVDYPSLQVTTYYPGASATLMAHTVTAPLEKQFALMPGLTQMSSTSSYGVSVISLSFSLDLSLDVAEQQVQAGINAAISLLPSELPLPPVYHKINPADTPIVTLAVSSEAMTQTELQAFIESRLSMPLSQISGVGLISLAGSQRPAIRIAVNPDALNAHQISLEQIRQTIANENLHLSKGSFQGVLRASSIDTNDQLLSVEDYARLILRHEQGSPLRLGQVASISQAAEDVYRRAWYQNKPAILLTIYRQPNSNVIAVAESVKALVASLQDQLPASVTVEIASDRTQAIRSMIQATTTDLWLAIGFVIAVIWLFLRQWRLTLIPALTIPLSLLTSLAVLQLFGFSINLLSLLALIIATGFVVDDSIVMLENISRHRAQGKSAMTAAMDGAGEITLTIVALTLALLAVMIPLLFMQGVVGRLFYEFALTLSVAMIASAFISLTLTPMLAGHWLTRVEMASSTTSAFTRLRDGYVHWLGISLRHPRLMLLLTLSMMLAGIWLLYALPKSFFPTQDTEQIRGVMVASEQASFEAVNDHLLALGERLAQDPNVSSVSSFVGVDAQNPSPITGMISIQLLPKAARLVSAQQLARHFEAMAEEVVGIHFYATATQAMNLDATPSPSAYQVRLSSPDRQQMAQHTRQLALAMQDSPYFMGVGHSLQTEGLGLQLQIDKDKASYLGINQKDINTALYNAFGQRMIATLFGQSQYQRVILTLDPAYQQQPEQLNQLHIPNQQGELIPLSNFATLASVITPLQLEKHHQFPAARIFFDLAPQVGLDSALDEIERLRQGLAGVQAVKLEPTGALAVFAQSQWQQIGLLLGAIIAVYILLGMLYESLIHPLTILSTLLPAVLGGLLSLWFLSLSLDMIAMIAMVLLVGIVMKNAIMMIDFALSALRTQDISAREAIMQASSLRFRPIMMTSMVALLAAVPLVLGNSLGSELRFVMGSVMIGGLILSQLLTLFTTPALFLLYENGRDMKG